MDPDAYPRMLTPVNHVAPVPRRVRAYVGNDLLLDTTNARYVWEQPYFPAYYHVPRGDVAMSLLVDLERTEQTPARIFGLDEVHGGRPGMVKIFTASDVEGLVDTARVDWDAADTWVRGGRAGLRPPP